MSYQPAILQAIPAHASYLTWTIRSGADRTSVQQSLHALLALTDGDRIVTGIGAAAGGLGGVLVQLLAGGLEDKFRMQGVTDAINAGLVKVTNALPVEKIKIDNLKDVLVDPAYFDQAKDMISTNVSVAYGIMFSVCALSYLIAWGVMKSLVPKHKPITDL